MAAKGSMAWQRELYGGSCFTAEYGLCCIWRYGMEQQRVMAEGEIVVAEEYGGKRLERRV